MTAQTRILECHFYVLGLDRNFRGLSLLESLRSTSQNVEVVNGIDGSSLNEFDIDRIYSRAKSILYLKRELSRGEIGCALSHQKIYSLVSQQVEALSFIFEDDVRIIDVHRLIRTVRFISEFVLEKRGPMVVQFGTTPQTESRGSQYLNLLRTSGPANGTWAYLLNKAAAERLTIHHPHKIWLTADWPLSAQKIEWWKLDTALVETGHAQSLICEERNVEITKRHSGKEKSKFKRISLALFQISGLYIFVKLPPSCWTIESYLFFLPKRFRTFISASKRIETKI